MAHAITFLKAGKTLVVSAVFFGSVICGCVSAAETTPESGALGTVAQAVRSAGQNEMKREERSTLSVADDADGPKVASSVIALLTQALNERRVVAFTYHGYTREVEPHALGIAKSGGVALLAFQIAGGSESEPPPGWRTFVVSEMSKLQLPVTEVERSPTGRNASGSGVAVKNSGPELVGLPRTFAAPRPSYRKEHTAFLSIEAEVRGAGVGTGVGVTKPERGPSASDAGAVSKTTRRAKR